MDRKRNNEDLAAGNYKANKEGRGPELQCPKWHDHRDHEELATCKKGNAVYVRLQAKRDWGASIFTHGLMSASPMVRSLNARLTRLKRLTLNQPPSHHGISTKD